MQTGQVAAAPNGVGPGAANPSIGGASGLENLYIVDGVLLCRCCHKLDYRSRHVLHPALIRAAKLRRKLDAAPGLLSRLPPRPPHWRRDYWARALRDLAAAESVLVEMLRATVRAAKRQRVKTNGRR